MRRIEAGLAGLHWLMHDRLEQEPQPGDLASS
jgi:hypothetical protein